MNRPVVLVDVDGVLADFQTAAFKEIDRIGIKLTIDEYNLSQRMWDFCAHPKLEAHRAEIQQSWKRAGFCAEIKPYAGARDGIKMLREVADVYACTAHMRGNPTWVHERDEWLIEHFAFDHKHLIHTHAKYRVHGDMLIDDKPSNVEKWMARHPHAFAILWSQPYNIDATMRGALRTESWHQVQNLLRRRAEVNEGRW